MKVLNYDEMKELLWEKYSLSIDGLIEEAERHEMECGSNYGSDDFDYDFQLHGKNITARFTLEQPAIDRYDNDLNCRFINRNDEKSINTYVNLYGYDLTCEEEEPIYTLSLLVL